jgi:hypothetical protein
VRFGTNILEAYTQATLEINYFAWVYEYMKENHGSTLKAEYDIAGDDNATNDDRRLFCGDLEHVEIAAPQIGKMASPTSTKLLIDEDKDSEEIEQARKDNELVRKRVMERIASGNHIRLNTYMRAKLELEEGSAPSNEGQAGMREARKRKRKSMKEMKRFTSIGLTKKRKKASDRLGGWTDEGRKFVVDMTKKIKSDVDSGLHGEWEKIYEELCKAINGAERAEENISEEAMEAECKVLFEEV